MKIFPKKNSTIGIISLLVATALACERHTKLSIEGGNPPRFVMTGSGSLGSIRIRGPKRQREGDGEDALLYWEIRNEKGEARRVQVLGAVTYGKVPDNYRQKYPEHGDASPLIEGERYNIRVTTFNANGADMYFTIHDGKVVDVSDN